MSHDIQTFPLQEDNLSMIYAGSNINISSCLIKLKQLSSQTQNISPKIITAGSFFHFYFKIFLMIML